GLHVAAQLVGGLEEFGLEAEGGAVAVVGGFSSGGSLLFHDVLALYVMLFLLSGNGPTPGLGPVPAQHDAGLDGFPEAARRVRSWAEYLAGCGVRDMTSGDTIAHLAVQQHDLLVRRAPGGRVSVQPETLERVVEQGLADADAGLAAAHAIVE